MKFTAARATDQQLFCPCEEPPVRRPHGWSATANGANLSDLKQPTDKRGRLQQLPRPSNTRDIQMGKGKHKTIRNRSQRGLHQNPVLPPQQALNITTYLTIRKQT